MSKRVSKTTNRTNVRHTKGPWEVYSEIKRDVVNEAGDLIATAYIQGEDREDEREAMSNARLIAAAPELLEAAKQIGAELARLGYGSKATDLDDLTVNLAIAVAKAEGSGNE